MPKDNASYYLSIFLLDIWDNSTRNKFLGYSSEWGDMSTDLTSQYDSYFEEAAQTYGVPVALLKAMGKTESNFNQSAVSGVGAIGIMQLMPATAASLGVDPYDARQNIMGGAKYIAGNLERFKDYSNGLELAIAAYNAGPGAVIKYGYQIPPYKETQNYVKKVLGYLTIAEGKTENGADTESDEDLSEPYQLLKNAVTEHVDSFFSWSVTDEKEQAATESKYYQISETGKIGIDKDTYEKMKKDGENVVIETVPVTKKTVEYTLALLLNSQPQAGSERVGKDRMDYVVQSLKEGKMVVEICEAYTITGSGSGHFIVLTGVTRDGYITIADCASRERSTSLYLLIP